MNLSICEESNREGEFSSLKELPYSTVDDECSSSKTPDVLKILNEQVSMKSGEKIIVDSFFVPDTFGYALEVSQFGKLVLQLTAFHHFDVVCLTTGGNKVRFFAGQPPSA